MISKRPTAPFSAKTKPSGDLRPSTEADPPGLFDYGGAMTHTN